MRQSGAWALTDIKRPASSTRWRPWSSRIAQPNRKGGPMPRAGHGREFQESRFPTQPNVRSRKPRRVAPPARRSRRPPQTKRPAAADLIRLATGTGKSKASPRIFDRCDRIDGGFRPLPGFVPICSRGTNRVRSNRLISFVINVLMGARDQLSAVRYQVSGIRCQGSGARDQAPGIRRQDDSPVRR